MGYKNRMSDESGPYLTYGAVKLLNVPYAAEVAREIFDEDCYNFDRIPAGSIVLDIGAFYGEFAIRCVMEKQCRVIACEPSYQNRRILELNRELNKLTDDQLAISPLAIGTPGPRNFQYHPEHPAGSMLKPHDVEALSANVYAVDCVGIEDLIRVAKNRWGDLPICVKMDCEGAEHEIFADLEWIDQVTVIAMEWHCYDGEHFRSLIEPRGLSVHVEGGGPKPRPAWDPSIGGGLLFAVRNGG